MPDTIKPNIMTVSFTVTVTFQPIEPQSKKSFAKEDGKAMIPYIREKLEDALMKRDTWQWNAQVTKTIITKKSKLK